jgi:outer membrane immunogenic protein
MEVIMKKLILLSIAALSLTATPVSAGEDGQAYVNIGGTVFNDAGIAITGRVGYNFAQYFGIEGEGSVGVSDSSSTFSGTNFDTDINSSFAGFGVGRMPLGEQFSVFGRVGYHSTSIGVKSTVVSGSRSIDGIAFGGGIEFMFDEKNGFRTEYTRFDGNVNAVSGGIDTFSASYVRKF